MEVVQQYTIDFHNILQKFNCLPPSIEPTATGHIIEQIEIVKEIIENGFAYEKTDRFTLMSLNLMKPTIMVN